MPTEKTTGTFYVFPKGSTKARRVTCTVTGDFKRPNGIAELFDPTTARYATPGMVGNLVANSDPEHPIIVRGDTTNAARVLAEVHAWKQFLTLEEACAHKHLGKTMPSAEVIIARYQERLQAASELDC